MSGLKFGRVVGSTVDKNKDGVDTVRLLQVLLTTRGDVQTVQLIEQAGEESNPPNGSLVAVDKIGEALKVSGGVQSRVEPVMERGGKRLYSTDASHNVQAEIRLLPDGTIQAFNAQTEIIAGTNGNISIVTTGDVTLEADGAVAATVGGGLIADVTGDIDVLATGNITADVDGDATVYAANVTCVATTDIDISATQITLTGAVNIVGALDVTQDVTAGSALIPPLTAPISLISHVHPETGGTTGPPQ